MIINSDPLLFLTATWHILWLYVFVFLVFARNEEKKKEKNEKKFSYF
jgi:hypothetical protein